MSTSTIDVKVNLNLLDLSSIHTLEKDLNTVFKQLKANTVITDLNLSHQGRHLKSAWVSFIEMLKENQTIQKLNLSGNEIDDSLLQSLMEALSQIPKLKELNLAKNKISFVRPIISFFKKKVVLETLDLSDNPIDDKSAILFAGVTKNWSLKNLLLNGTKITIKGAKIIDESLDGETPMSSIMVL